jgi:hypothetical protein
MLNDFVMKILCENFFVFGNAQSSALRDRRGKYIFLLKVKSHDEIVSKRKNHSNEQIFCRKGGSRDDE